jgi:glycosyltransferase involved in cell wall biosynthesis
MLLIIKPNKDYPKYKKEFLSCLSINANNNLINEILVFLEEKNSDLPNIQKVKYFVKNNYSNQQIIEHAKKINKIENKIIWTEKNIEFNNNLLVNSKYKTNIIKNDNYIILNRNSNLSNLFEQKLLDHTHKPQPEHQLLCIDENKLVSIIITNYNCSDYISKAIESCINQTYKNLEILIIDDDSTDNSLDVINKYLYDKRVNVYKINKNVGPYWLKNSLIQKINGDYVTMLDSDDYYAKDKIENQIIEFNNDKSLLLVSCSSQRINEKASLGYPSMMWKKEVFDKIGFYDSVRVGADSEMFDRFMKIYKNKNYKHISKVLYFCPERRKEGLTSKIPENSIIRKEYVKYYKEHHEKLKDLKIEFPLLNRNFNAPEEIIQNHIPFYNIEKIESENDTLPVIMCVWKRLAGFEMIIKQLNNQKFTNFKLFVWNNNLELEKQFEKLLNKAKFEYEIHHSKENVGGFGRFFYAKKIRRKPGILDYCVFIDDDQRFGKNLLETFYKEREKNTIKSQWGWQFTGLNYYTDRKLVKIKESIHYAGTGGMIADMKVFEDDDLFDCKKEYWFVEDLWLSFYANKYHNYKLIKSAADMINGDDEHSLYKIVLDVKTPMLNYLIKEKKWDILENMTN